MRRVAGGLSRPAVAVAATACLDPTQITAGFLFGFLAAAGGRVYAGSDMGLRALPTSLLGPPLVNANLGPLPRVAIAPDGTVYAYGNSGSSSGSVPISRSAGSCSRRPRASRGPLP